jgi:hypothetical protein
VAQVAAADAVQDQLQLMEQRMAEMEDRLQATSDELQTAKATVNEQRSVLSTNGLIEDEGLRSGVGSFFDSVDVSGVAAASFNYRLVDSDVTGNLDGQGELYNGQGNQLFKNPNSNTFQVDQIWLTLDKASTEESRGGFHAEFVTGASATVQGNNNTNDGTPYIYAASVNYLADIGNGVEVNLGRLGTVLGAEVVQTNGNFNITQGAVFGLQPVTYTGVSFDSAITDEISLHFGIVNDVYSDTMVSTDNDKAYVGQISYSGESFGLNVGGIIGEDGGDANVCAGADCQTSVVDVLLTLSPTENLDLWLNYDWKHTSGDDTTRTAGQSINGDAHGIAGAGRLGLSDTMGFATRIEYVTVEDSLAGTDKDIELLTLTGTLDKTLAEGLVTRLELRWDHNLNDDVDLGLATSSDSGQNDNQLVAMWQMYYEF